MLDTKEEDVMQVAQYTFQSPSSSQVQIGKPDAIVNQSQSSAPTNANETVTKAQSFAATQVSEVKPTVESSKLLDVYA